MVFYVDFLKQSSLLEDVGSFLVATVVEALSEDHEIDLYEGNFVRAVYNKEINQFKRGLYAALRTTDPAEYARRELNVLSDHLEN